MDPQAARSVQLMGHTASGFKPMPVGTESVRNKDDAVFGWTHKHTLYRDLSFISVERELSTAVTWLTVRRILKGFL